MERDSSSTPRKAGAQFSIHEDPVTAESSMVLLPGCSSSNNNSKSLGVKGHSNTLQPEHTFPLTTSKMGNQYSPSSLRTASIKKLDISEAQSPDARNSVNTVLGCLTRQKQHPVEKEVCFDQAEEFLNSEEQHGVSIGTIVSQPGNISRNLVKDDPEVRCLREQLAVAQNKIAVMNHELSQQRNVSNRSHLLCHSPKAFLDDDISSTTSGKQSPALNDGSAGHWSDKTTNRSASMPFASSPIPQQHSENAWHSTFSPCWASSGDGRFEPSVAPRFPNTQQQHKPPPHRAQAVEATTGMHSFRTNPAIDNTAHTSNVGSSYYGIMGGQSAHGWNSQSTSITSTPSFTPPVTPLQFGLMGNIAQTHHAPYQPRPIGTPLSPTAMEFSTLALNNTVPSTASSWSASHVHSENNSVYMQPMEPMNYRRLLDKNMNCNWKYIVDKIVCSNDQQASIFLQQKLKVATAEQKVDLIDAIIAQAYPLMINRFGNFLVQRCFEHGTPDQIIAIANAIRGNTLNLSMDAFGCHVVQKAFDVVPEEYKAVMVHELLRRIPETVIHRYACHVWQKLFELRWSDSPPQIMKYVNESLRGMWHEVALGETGSLVVQNIFENCLEEDKRPCINEVLTSIDVISHGQFGNWCIQHICEHGAPPDKSRATEHVLHFATEYSIDQFASKVIEKCLKVGGSEFLERYLEKVCEGRPDRPRMPLIDIAGDQYGNYLIQYILIHATPQHRELVATHIRKHMVSLRGSKFGSRVAMLCSNPALATRPGPPAGMQINNRFPSNLSTSRPPPNSHFR